MGMLALACVCVWAGAANERTDEQPQLARAQLLLQQARTALGGEEAWNRLQSLLVRLKVERVIKYISVEGPDKIVEKERTLEGKMELDFLLPDRFRRKVSTETFGNYKYSFAEIVNGEKAFRDPPLQVRSYNGDNRVVDVGDVERTLNVQTQSAQQQLSFYTLLYLLRTPSCIPIKWRYEGLHRLSDQVLGDQLQPVEVLLGVAPDNFHPILMFDPKTHLPLGLAIVYTEAIRQNVVVEVAALDRGYLRRTFQRAAQERRARTQPVRRHELRWLLSDYRQVEGLLLPHHIAITRDGVLLEEMTVRELKLNRPINPKKFEGEAKVKF
jgi:hypothetical protein